MRKIIHSKFEINISNLKLTDTQQNSMFTDGFFAKTTFPFDIDLTDELEQQFDFISDYNTSVNTIYDVTYVHNSKQEKAKLEILQIIGTKISATLLYGFEEYPSFSKKLPELSLEKFDLPTGTDIYQHANTIVNQTYPAVNYNFPQIHTDKYKDNEDFVHFENIINNRKEGNFIENIYDIDNFTSLNKNIIQPLPYALHILQQGFLEGGYTLAGNILEDVLLIRATIYGDVDYFFKENVNTESLVVKTSDFFSTDGFWNGYKIGLMIQKTGLYKVSGSYIVKTNVAEMFNPKCQINLDGISTPFDGTDTFEETSNNNFFKFCDNHEIFIFIKENTLLEIEVTSLEMTEYDILFNGNLSFVTNATYENGVFTPFPIIENKNKIDLTKAVPDITFGEYVTFIKNYLNYDITGIDGDLIYMNRVEDKFNSIDVIDLSMFDKKNPVRKFKQGSSYLLKFQDFESKEYTYKKVFQNHNQVLYDNYVIDAEKTSTIEINGLPLPLLNRGVNTAHAFESNSGKVFIVPYTGLTNGLNLSLTITDFLLENVHPIYWYLWLNFRINSKTFEWDFISENEIFLNLGVKNIIHAYRNIHFIKSLTKTEIKPGLFEYELETEA